MNNKKVFKLYLKQAKIQLCSTQSCNLFEFVGCLVWYADETEFNSAFVRPLLLLLLRFEN